MLDLIDQGHGMLSSSSTIEQSSTDRHFASGYFRTYPSSFIEALDGSSDVISSSSCYRQRSQEVEMSSGPTSMSRQLPPPPLSGPFMEPFGGYGNRIPQNSTLFSQQQYQFNSLQQRNTHLDPHQSVQATLPTIPASFAARRFEQLQQRRLGVDAALPLVTSLSATCDKTVASTPRSSESASVTAAAALSNTSSFDLYYGGRVEDSLAQYNSPYLGQACEDTAGMTSCSAHGRVSAFTAAVSSKEPFQMSSMCDAHPEMSSVRSSSSMTSSSSGCGLTIDDTTAISSSSLTTGRRHQQSDKSRGRRAAVAVPSDRKDSAYFERRKKNNESARRSRESRHSKEQMTLADCQQVRERNAKIKIQIGLLQREYNEMCRSAYGRIGPAAASRLTGPPSSSSYGYSLLTQADGPSIESEPYMTSLVPAGDPLSTRISLMDNERILAAANQCV